jgi:hypothetical protein
MQLVGDIIFLNHPVKNSENFCHPSGGGECDPGEFKNVSCFGLRGRIK